MPVSRHRHAQLGTSIRAISKWYVRSDWFMNLDTIPSNDLNRNNALEAVREGVRNIVHSRNSCGMADRVNADALYQGDDNEIAQIGYTLDGQRTTCASDEDGTSVVSFGDRQPGVLASVCVWQAGGGDQHASIYGADMEIDRTNRRWTTVGGDACNEEWDLESIATHEFGHWFGLGHSNGEALTMYGAAFGTCNFAMRTLGRGDVLGLRQYY